MSGRAVYVCLACIMLFIHFAHAKCMHGRHLTARGGDPARRGLVFSLAREGGATAYLSRLQRTEPSRVQRILRTSGNRTGAMDVAAVGRVLDEDASLVRWALDTPA